MTKSYLNFSFCLDTNQFDLYLYLQLHQPFVFVFIFVWMSASISFLPGRQRVLLVFVIAFVFVLLYLYQGLPYFSFCQDANQFGRTDKYFSLKPNRGWDQSFSCFHLWINLSNKNELGKIWTYKSTFYPWMEVLGQTVGDIKLVHSQFHVFIHFIPKFKRYLLYLHLQVHRPNGAEHH